MSPGIHAKLSASGAHRWLHCPPSVALEEQFPEESSAYAEEGTFAHLVAETYLLQAIAPMTKAKWNAKQAELKANQYWSQALHDYISEYAARVLAIFTERKQTCPDAKLLLEQRLDFSRWVPGGFGTGDVVIIADGTVEVMDLKYGAGVPVSAKDNPQLRLYGLGAIEAFDFIYGCAEVTMTIIQPRLDSISSETMSAANLLAWAGNTIMPAAALAEEGKGEYQAGDHCKFCRARFTCRARAEANLEAAKKAFTDPALLTDGEIAEIIGKAENLISWANDVQAYALDQAENHGKHWPGWKLVEGRSNRKYADEDLVADALRGLGVQDAIMYERRFLTLTKLEDAVGKKLIANLPDGLIIKPAGKPALVPTSDKRPEINTLDAAKAIFNKED